MSTIGERIKAKRKELGLTQAELGEKLNITDRAVSKWEQGEGNPDMSIIASLATILGVSLDYLIIGKEPEEKIIIKSPKDILMENDDPSYLDKVTDLTINDIYKNRLVNVFKYLLDNKKVSNYFRRGLEASDYYRELLFLCLISNSLDKLHLFRFNDIGFSAANEWDKEMLDAFVKNENVSDETRKYVLSSHSRKLTGCTVSDGLNSESTHLYGTWQLFYPVLLNAFVAEKKWDWVKYIIDIGAAINGPVKDIYAKEKASGRCDHKFSFTPYATTYHETGFFTPVFGIKKEVLKTLLEEEQFDLLEYAIEVNAMVGGAVLDKRSIELKKMKTSTEVSLKERLVYEYTNNFILNYRGLLSSNTVTIKGPSKEEDRDGFYEALLSQYKDLYKEIILENPTSFIELLYRGISEGSLSKIFQIAVDYDIKPLKNALLIGKLEDIITAAKNVFVYTEEKTVKTRNGFGEMSSYFMGGKWITTLLDVNEPSQSAYQIPCVENHIKWTHGLLQVDNLSDIPNDVKDAIKFFNKKKAQIIADWAEDLENRITHIRVAKENEEAYLRIKDEITSQYLVDLISKGGTDLAIIKLCVKLESILKHKFDLTGDLFTMLDSFFAGPLKHIEAYRPTDDEDNNYSRDMAAYNEQCRLNELHKTWIGYLSKLRMKRNELVHAEKASVEFTTKDLEQCISIVEEIDK